MKQPQTDTEGECRGAWRTAMSHYSFAALDGQQQWEVVHLDRMIAAIEQTADEEEE